MKKSKKSAHRARIRQQLRNIDKPPSEANAMRQKLGQMQGALTNLRGMYDAATQEKERLKAQVMDRDKILTVLAVRGDLAVLDVDRELVDEGLFIGYKADRDEKMRALVISAVEAPEEVDDEWEEGQEG